MRLAFIPCLVWRWSSELAIAGPSTDHSVGESAAATAGFGGEVAAKPELIIGLIYWCCSYSFDFKKDCCIEFDSHREICSSDCYLIRLADSSTLEPSFTNIIVSFDR